MTAGQAIEQADELRPNNQFTDSLKQSWLHQCDARMRTSIVQRSRTADFDAVGADVNWNEGLELQTATSTTSLRRPVSRMPPTRCSTPSSTSTRPTLMP